MIFFLHLNLFVSYLSVPPLASCSRPSSGSAVHFPGVVANLIPSLAKLPTFFPIVVVIVGIVLSTASCECVMEIAQK